MSDDIKMDPKVEEAKSRMSHVASGLAIALGPDMAAFILAGASVAVLTKAYDREAAAQYLRDLASAIENDDELAGRIEAAG
jgi:hypothetical protein